MVAKGKRGEGWMDQEFGVSRYKLFRIDKQRGPTVSSTGNYTQYPMINHNGKEYKR